LLRELTLPRTQTETRFLDPATEKLIGIDNSKEKESTINLSKIKTI